MEPCTGSEAEMRAIIFTASWQCWHNQGPRSCSAGGNILISFNVKMEPVITAGATAELLQTGV